MLADRPSQRHMHCTLQVSIANSDKPDGEAKRSTFNAVIDKNAASQDLWCRRLHVMANRLLTFIATAHVSCCRCRVNSDKPDGEAKSFTFDAVIDKNAILSTTPVMRAPCVGEPTTDSHRNDTWIVSCRCLFEQRQARWGGQKPHL